MKKLMGIPGEMCIRDRVKRAREEWLEETGGVYECPIPDGVGPRLNE